MFDALKRGSCVAALAVVVALRVAHADEAPGQTAEAVEDPGAAALRQLDAAEYEAARILSEQLVSEFDADGRLYDRALVEPLRILGDAHAALGDTEAALDAYERARYVVRMNDGLDSQAQIDLLEREAAIFVRERDWKSANDREETIYGLMLAMHGRSAAIVPAQVRLADWYRQNGLLTLATDLYKDAAELLEAAEAADTRALGEIYHRVGLTYREYRWPSKGQRRVALRAEPDGWQVGHPASGYLPRFSGLAGMLKGTKAMKKAKTALRASADATVDQVVDAILDDGDTLMLFQRYGRAEDRYAEAFEFVRTVDPDQLVDVFGAPVPIFQPHPGNSRKPGTFGPGVPARIEFSATIDKRGAVRNIRTTSVEPPQVTIYDYRKAARRSRYRPAIVDGKPVAAEAVPIVFDFRYHPR